MTEQEPHAGSCLLFLISLPADAHHSAGAMQCLPFIKLFL